MNKILHIARSTSGAALHTEVAAFLSETTNHGQLRRDVRCIFPSMAMDAAQPARTVVYKDSFTELTLLGWSAGNTTGWHAHPGMYVSFSVLLGELVELVKSPDGQMGRFVHAAHARVPSAMASLDDAQGVHNVLNARCRPALSLHLQTRF